MNCGTSNDHFCRAFEKIQTLYESSYKMGESLKFSLNERSNVIVGKIDSENGKISMFFNDYNFEAKPNFKLSVEFHSLKKELDLVVDMSNYRMIGIGIERDGYSLMIKEQLPIKKITLLECDDSYSEEVKKALEVVNRHFQKKQEGLFEIIKNLVS